MSSIFRRTMKLILFLILLTTFASLSFLHNMHTNLDPSHLADDLQTKDEHVRNNAGSKVMVLRQLEMVHIMKSDINGKHNAEQNIDRSSSNEALEPDILQHESFHASYINPYLKKNESINKEYPSSFAYQALQSITLSTPTVAKDSPVIENTPVDTLEDMSVLPCDEECEKFQVFFQTWPKDKPRAAFYYLTQSSRLRYLKRSLESVDKFFNKQFQYPIIIFHEEEMIDKRNMVREMTSSTLFFQKVTFTLPNFLDKPVIKNIPCLSEISYRHMCRFHAKGVYREPIMRNLSYHWRLDDDSLLLSQVPYDVFTFMDKHYLKYGYVWIFLDSVDCTEGLWEATDTFIQKYNITPHFYSEWKRPRLFYNNFEISHLDIWRSPQYQDYINYIDSLGGIYYHRWGDAPIKGLAVSLFLGKNETHFFKDIGYQHRTFINNASYPSPPKQYLFRLDEIS